VGTSFFKGNKQHAAPVTGSNTTQLARALNAGQYGARGAGIGAQKALAGAQAVNKAAISAHGPLKRSAAYPPGPKV
jgi:hypothetical protein